MKTPNTAPLPPRVYPLDPPENDPRFTLGLTLDVREVLQKQGYPELGPLDIVELQQALFRFLYRSRHHEHFCVLHPSHEGPCHDETA